MDGLDCFGCYELGEDPADDRGSFLGFNWGGLFDGASGLVKGGLSAYQEDQAKKKLDADNQKKVDAAIKADREASLAVARASVSATLKQASAAVDATAAQRALDAQDRAAAVLSPEGSQARATAADKAADDALAAAQAKPTDGYLAALAKAWAQTANKAHAGSILSADDADGTAKSKGKGEKKESWFTRPVIGPVPGYGVVAGGAGLAVGLGFIVKRLFFK